MIYAYAILIINRRRTINQIPKKFRESVKKTLKEIGYEGELDE